MNALTQLTAFLVVLALSASSVVQSPAAKGQNFELLILHNNDMHARFEQTSQLSGTCTTADRDAGKCYGGFPRVAYVVKEARKAAASGEGPPVLYLNAGDTYTGTAWFTIYKWKIAAEFINALQPDAVSLGNNDIKRGYSDVSPLLKNINTQILATNVILKDGETNKNLHKSIIFDIGGRKVGLVGYLTPKSDILDNTYNIEYVNEVLALREEVETLQAQDVKIIIALGHSTPDKDLEIAKEVEGIDVVIGGHKNTFYWNGKNADSQLPLHDEPRFITQSSGKQVLIVKSYSYNEYLGNLKVEFNDDGEIVNFNADPITLGQSVPQDAESVQILNNLNINWDSLDEVVGSTAVVLDGTTCKTNECNLGNLVADAIMYYYATRYEGDTWTDAAIVIILSASLESSIAPSNRPAAVTTGDIISAIPLESNLVAVTVSGLVLNQVLEHAVAGYSKENPGGELLQFSGIRAVYDMSKEPGSRLVSAVARCWSCVVPDFFAIDDWRDYKIIMPIALADGNFGYSMLAGLPRQDLAYDEVTSLGEFIAQRSPVYPEVAERLVLNNLDLLPDSATAVTSTITSLGNHEFDNGVSGLTPFIENLTCPVLAANLVLNKVPELENEPNLMKSVIFDVNGIKIGVIGYLTPDTKVLAIRSDVEYIEEVEAIKAEAAKLKQQGIKILIALGHSGFTKDLQIAKEVKDIDLVIGGHTNTFLWNGVTLDIENPEGPYPMLVKQASGRIVPAVQAYAYTKYLGRLHLVFDSDGEIIEMDGNPVLLNNSIPQDPDMLNIVNRYSDKIKRVTELVVGQTSVILDGHSCRLRECNMGNLITDAMVHTYASKYVGFGWTDAPIAVMQGGGIRSSISHLNKTNNVTTGDFLIVMPFDGNIALVTVNGSILWQMLEHSVSRYYTKRPLAQFLQVSGIQVVYDFSKKPGSRVVSASVRCGLCDVPTYSPIDKLQSYKILMTSFLSMGGDGFTMLIDLPSTPLPYDELQSTIKYVKTHSPIIPSLENRIIINNYDKLVNRGMSATLSLYTLLFVLFTKLL